MEGPLLRTIAVLALALPAVLLLGLVVPGEAPFAWLLPAVGFVAVVLAAALFGIFLVRRRHLRQLRPWR
jgi:hypothetical protein